MKKRHILLWLSCLCMVFAGCNKTEPTYNYGTALSNAVEKDTIITPKEAENIKEIFFYVTDEKQVITEKAAIDQIAAEIVKVKFKEENKIPEDKLIEGGISVTLVMQDGQQTTFHCDSNYVGIHTQYYEKNSIADLLMENGIPKIEAAVLKERVYQHNNYSLSINEEWTTEETDDFLTLFYKAGELAVRIEVFENCEFCSDTETILSNIYGYYGEELSVIEETVGDYIRIKSKTAQDVSVTEENDEAKEQPANLHYIYTNYKDLVIDIDIQEGIADENEIAKMINSMVINSEI